MNEKIDNNNNQNQNEIQNSKSKTSTIVIVILTIITLVLSIYYKTLTFGIATIVSIPLIAICYSIFIITAIRLSSIKEKSILDYIIFLVICITLILYSLTFVDSYDSGEKISIIKTINTKTLSSISNICIYSSMGFSIIELIMCHLKQKKENC